MTEIKDSLIKFNNGNNEKNNLKKCGIFVGFLSCGLMISGLLFFNIKCGSFNQNLDVCKLPDYCPVKNLCDGSELI
tara:strand:+ start:357 stop:584 length:228 start_codon:yes stop_codon:yes gene_type:complete